METKVFFQFEIIINVLVCSFRFIWIHMLWVYKALRNILFIQCGGGGGLLDLTSIKSIHALKMTRKQLIICIIIIKKKILDKYITIIVGDIKWQKMMF